MLIKNIKVIEKKKKYYCYSPPLCQWLKETKNIFPIYADVYKKPGKFFGNEFEVYIITDELDSYLQEWTVNKKVENKDIEGVASEKA